MDRSICRGVHHPSAFTSHSGHRTIDVSSNNTGVSAGYLVTVSSLGRNGEEVVFQTGERPGDGAGYSLRGKGEKSKLKVLFHFVGTDLCQTSVVQIIDVLGKVRLGATCLFREQLYSL